MNSKDLENHFQLVFDGLNEGKKERSFDELIAGDMVQCFKDHEHFNFGDNYRVKYLSDFTHDEKVIVVMDEKREFHSITQGFFDSHFIGWAA